MSDENDGSSAASIFFTALLNIILLGLLILFWLATFNVGLPEGLGGGKFIVFFHLAVIAGLYKVNKKYFK